MRWQHTTIPYRIGRRPGQQGPRLPPYTGVSSKIRGRDNITIGTWNTRTLRAAGKLQELTHEMDRYSWNILGICEMRWKNFNEATTRKDTRFSSVEKRIKTSMALDFLSQGHRELCHGISPSLRQAHHHPSEGSPFQHHNSTSVRPKVRL